jgi:uncharacterized protein DUF3352
MRRAITSVSIAILMLASVALVNRAMSSSTVEAVNVQAADQLFSAVPDSDAVASINVSQLYRQVQGLVSTKANVAAALQKQLDRIVADTGVDIRALDYVVVGFSLGSGKKIDPVIVASGRFNESQILASVAKSSKKQLNTETYKGIRIHSEQSGGSGKSHHGVVSFLDENTVAIGSAESIRLSIDTRTGNHPSAAQNTGLMAALGQASGGASIRFAARVPEELRKQITGNDELGGMLKPLSSVNQVSGSIDLGSNGLQANISLLTPSDQEAGDVVSLINNGLVFIRMAIGNSPEGQKLASVLNGITNTQAGSAANITLTVPAELIQELLERFEPKSKS